MREKQSTYLSVMQCQKPLKIKTQQHPQPRHCSSLPCPACWGWPCTPVPALGTPVKALQLSQSSWKEDGNSRVVLINALASAGPEAGLDSGCVGSPGSQTWCFVARPCANPLLLFGICKIPLVGPGACGMVHWI